jgi:hypothetical protein
LRFAAQPQIHPDVISILLKRSKKAWSEEDLKERMKARELLIKTVSTAYFKG